MHPHEYLDAIEDKTAALIRELEAKHAEAHRELRRGPRKASCPTGTCRGGYTAEQLAEVPF